MFGGFILNTEEIKNELIFLRGKTIAIVYIFEGDNGSGFEHFFIGKVILFPFG